MNSPDRLSYEFHWSQAKSQFGLDHHTINDETWRYAERWAQDGQALYVFDPLRDLTLHAIETAKLLKNNNAQNYMRFGAGRRLSMMFYAFREIFATAHPKREEPLTHDQEQMISRDINVLYMHARGVLDNYAWTLLYETNVTEAESIVTRDRGRMLVDLFHPKFKNLCPLFSSIESDIKKHTKWNSDLKQRRDPVAHRMPLYIPPSVIREDDIEAYTKLSQQHIDLATAHEFEKSQKIFEDLYKIGTFRPVFMHDPNDGPIPIYPTVPTDIEHIIKLSSVIFTALRDFRQPVT